MKRLRRAAVGRRTTLRGRAVRGVERGGLPGGGDRADAAVEDVGRREQGEPGVMVVVVARGEEVAESGAAVEVASEAAGRLNRSMMTYVIRNTPLLGGELGDVPRPDLVQPIAVSDGIACC